jgi:hypothetical protein
MRTIPETQEWAEQTPPGSAGATGGPQQREPVKANWANLKAMITRVQEEEHKKMGNRK